MTGPLANQRHELFCQHLVTGKLTQADAYREAGFKGNVPAMHANAARLITNDKIAARVAELREALFDRYEVTNDRIIREISLSGFARMKDYKALLLSGNLDDVTSEESAAVTEITVDRVEKRGGCRRKKGEEPEHQAEVVRTRIKLGDKHQSLVTLAKIKGLMRDSDVPPVAVNFIVEWTK